MLKQSGIREVLVRVKNRCVATIGRRRIVIAPPTTYWSSPEEFEALTASLGLVLRKKYRSPQLSVIGTPEENPYRWNYIFERP